MKKLLFLLFLGFLGLSNVIAQELNCTVLINTEAMQNNTANTNTRIYKEMKVAIEEFMNNRQWSEKTYKNHEKINCSITINLTSQPAIGSFYGNAQIAASRRVHGVNYETTLLNYLDKGFQFGYTEGRPMEYNDNAYLSNLTQLLAFYAYTIIGLEQDSYKEKSGTRMHQKAQNVVNNAQQTNASGWKSTGGTNTRYWLNDNLNNQQLLNFRKEYYNYHRKALDKLEKNPLEAQKEVVKVLKEIKKIRQTVPVSALIENFFDSKVDELVNIFSEGADEIKKEAYGLLRSLDATHNNKYLKIIKPKQQ